MLRGFRDFLLRGNVVELAVAVIIGAAFTAVVKAFADGVIGGILGAIGGTPDFGRAGVTINGTKIVYGTTLTALISFAITAAVVYFAVVLPLGRVGGLGAKKAGPTAEEQLLAEIRDLLAEQNGNGDRTPTAS